MPQTLTVSLGHRPHCRTCALQNVDTPLLKVTSNNTILFIYFIFITTSLTNEHQFKSNPSGNDKTKVASCLKPTLQWLTSPAVGHWGTCPLDFQQFNFFRLTLELHEVWRRLCTVPLQTHLYSATAAAVVQSRLREPCWVYYLCATKRFPLSRRTRSWRRHCAANKTATYRHSVRI